MNAFARISAPTTSVVIFGGESPSSRKPKYDAPPPTASKQTYRNELITVVLKGSLRSFFEFHSENWIAETQVTSSPGIMRKNSHFQNLLNLGGGAISFALERLEISGDRIRWMILLRSLANTDPVPPHKRGLTDDMAKEWVAWGKRNSYLPR